MEILNKNQRDSALWRLFGMGAVVLAIIAVMVSSMHREYAGQGSDELEKCRQERDGLKGAKYHAETQLNLSRDTINELRRSPDERIKLLEMQLNLARSEAERNEKLYKEEEKKLNKCEGELKAMKN